MNRDVTSVAGAVLVATAAFFFLGVAQRQQDEAAYQRGRAIELARSVAFVAEDDLLAMEPVPTASTAVQAYVTAITKQVPGVREASVLQGAKYFAHSDPALAGARLDRDSAADKRLYDVAARIKGLVASNVEERQRNPDLVRDAFAEVTFTSTKTGVLVSVPAKIDGEFSAMATVSTEERPIDLPPPWMVLVFGAAGVLLSLLLGLGALGRKARLGIGLVVLAAVLAANVWALNRWRGSVREAVRAAEVELIGQLAAAGLTAGDRDPALEIGRGELGERFTQLSAVRRDPAIQAGETCHQASGWSVCYDTAGIQRKWSEDRKHLSQWAILFGVLAVLGFVLGAAGQVGRFRDAAIQHRSAYYYLSPAVLGLLVLVFIPVAYGLYIGFQRRRYNAFEFAGLDNYIAILSNVDFSDTNSFYFKMAVTVLWTTLNVALHVSIGLFLALLLNDNMLKARGIYRVLLIVPWAIPNYITALIWKGMFHKQFGAVNFFMDALGFEPISWFQDFWPAFSTNVVTNTWLGFPFMMVISLGALQSIPADLYEAATVDGSNRWHRFRYITLPLLMPALVPAVIVGTVWTFNMFNIIYLVSGGAPNGATDILITDAFRWAFERDNYGYAAAYSTLIFLILLAFSVATNKITGATKGVFE